MWNIEAVFHVRLPSREQSQGGRTQELIRCGRSRDLALPRLEFENQRRQRGWGHALDPARLT